MRFFCFLGIASFVGLVYLGLGKNQSLTNRGGSPQGEISIVVRKPVLPFLTGTLEVWDNKGLWKSYHMIAGAMPGDKVREGDRKTPEGTFYICTKNLGRFGLSLGLSYPSLKNAVYGLENKVIEQSTYARIQRALDQKEKPPWDTPLGGAIMIHGGGLVNFWKIFYVGTHGCIRMEDADMKEVYQLTKVGTQVIIL